MWYIFLSFLLKLFFLINECKFQHLLEVQVKWLNQHQECLILLKLHLWLQDIWIFLLWISSKWLLFDSEQCLHARPQHQSFLQSKWFDWHHSLSKQIWLLYHLNLCSIAKCRLKQRLYSSKDNWLLNARLLKKSCFWDPLQGRKTDVLSNDSLQFLKPKMVLLPKTKWIEEVFIYLLLQNLWSLPRSYQHPPRILGWAFDRPHRVQQLSTSWSQYFFSQYGPTLFQLYLQRTPLHLLTVFLSPKLALLRTQWSHWTPSQSVSTFWVHWRLVRLVLL